MLANTAQGAVRAAQTGALAMLLLAAGCRVPPHEPTARAAAAGAPEATAVAVSAAAHGPVSAWPIDADRTAVTIIVRRAGPLARLGHDHVITSADEQGIVQIGATPVQSGFVLTLPVDRFEVDLPEARARAGAAFAAPVPDEARAGTRRNMLRPEVLDAARHPVITLRSSSAAGSWPQAVIRVAVELRGVTREFEIPVLIEREPQSVVARGELRFNQGDFGITPFSVAGGAIQVADTLEVRFEIVARAP